MNRRHFLTIAGCGLLARPILAQRERRTLNAYTIGKSTTLSGAAEVITLQQPTSGARIVQFVSAYIYSSAAVTISQERNGSAATSTAMTPGPVNPDAADAAKLTAFHTSNSNNASATILPPIHIPAGSSKTLDISWIQMRGNGTGKNYTIRTGSMTGDVIISVMWEEFDT